METIEQLRSDPRPLVSLSEVSAVTGEPLGELLLQLAEKDISLFLKRPEEARVFCVTQSMPMAFREPTYPEVIINLSMGQSRPGSRTPKRGNNHIDASQFSYLVLTSIDYIHLTENDLAPSAKLFKHTAYIDMKKNNPIIISASNYYRENSPKAGPIEKLKASFACYFQSKEWPSSLILTSINIKTEELLLSRATLLKNILKDRKPPITRSDDLLPHLQPWKSDLLIALNKAAFKLYSKDASRIFNKEEVIAAINQENDGSRQSKTTLNRLATLLRHDRQPAKYKKSVNNTSTKKYPAQFTPQLMYLNDMCEYYYISYQESENQRLPNAKTVKIDIQNHGVISKDTAIRVASALIPRLRQTML